MGGEQPPAPRSLSPTLGVPPLGNHPHADQARHLALLSAIGTSYSSELLPRSTSVPTLPTAIFQHNVASLRRSAPLEAPSVPSTASWTTTFAGPRSASPIVFEPCVYDPSFLQRNSKQEKLGASNF